MRIFDLLNDGDAAVALLASAHAPARQPSEPTSPSNDDNSNDEPPAFPAFLLNGVQKPWKPTPVEHEREDPALEPLSALRKAPTKPVKHAKTMSIFDIVATNPRSVLLHPQAVCKPKPVVHEEPQDEAPEPMPAPVPVLSRPLPRPPLPVAAPVPVPVPVPSKKRVRVVEEEKEEEENDEVPTDSQAQKRQRQRVLFRRNYYKRMNTISEMREVRQELEHEYAQLMWKRNAEQMVQTYLRQGRSRQPAEQVREAYMDLCRAKDLLRTENSAIEKELQDVRKVHDKMRWLVDAEGGLKADDRLDLTTYPDACKGADPLSVAECNDLAKACSDLLLRHVLGSCTRNAVLQTVFGWELRRQHVLANRLLLADKVLPRTKPEAVANKLWGCVLHANESEALRRIVGKAVCAQSYVVQNVNKDHQVVYLALGQRHALTLISRTVEEDKTIVTLQALPKPFGAEGQWLEELMAWVCFSKEPATSEATHVSLGMSLAAGSSSQEEYWLRLMAVASMELETQLVGAQAVQLTTT